MRNIWFQRVPRSVRGRGLDGHSGRDARRAVGGARVTAGDLVYVAIDSWAGRSTHLVRVEKVCAKRVKVTWLDASVLGRVQGETYYVPHAAITRVAKSHPQNWNRYLAEART